MIRQKLFKYVFDQWGTVPDYPWNDWNAILRHNNGKWYAMILEVERSKLHLDGARIVDVLNVKCNPASVSSLRIEDGSHPACHMDKQQWISI
jgi:predicted DNA-binding protein (MmcQ/YjbR family)